MPRLFSETLRLADQIILLKNGTVEAYDTLDQLLAARGEMRRLWAGKIGDDPDEEMPAGRRLSASP